MSLTIHLYIKHLPSQQILGFRNYHNFDKNWLTIFVNLKFVDLVMEEELLENKKSLNREFFLELFACYILFYIIYKAILIYLLFFSVI